MVNIESELKHISKALFVISGQYVIDEHDRIYNLIKPTLLYLYTGDRSYLDTIKKMETKYEQLYYRKGGFYLDMASKVIKSLYNHLLNLTLSSHRVVHDIEIFNRISEILCLLFSSPINPLEAERDILYPLLSYLIYRDSSYIEVIESYSEEILRMMEKSYNKSKADYYYYLYDSVNELVELLRQL